MLRCRAEVGDDGIKKAQRAEAPQAGLCLITLAAAEVGEVVVDRHPDGGNQRGDCW